MDSKRWTLDGVGPEPVVLVLPGARFDSGFEVSPAEEALASIDHWLGDPKGRAVLRDLHEVLSQRISLHLSAQNELQPSLRDGLVPAFLSGDVLLLARRRKWDHLAPGARDAAAQKPLVEVELVEGLNRRVAPEPGKPAHPEERAPTRFLVRWVDEIGLPIDGLDVTFSVSGRKIVGGTAADGVARFMDADGSNFAFAEVANVDALRDAVRPRWDAVRGDRLLDETEAFVVSVRGSLDGVQLDAERMRIVSVQPHVARTRLLGAGFFDTAKSFLLPEGLGGIRAIVANYDREQGAKLLIVGHTDTAGARDYNDRLSVERAEALKDYLTDNVDGWLKWYGQVPFEKRWGAKEDQLMIDSLPDAGARALEESAVRWFQRTRGLTLDGIAGPETRRQLVKEYMALDGTSLPAGIEPTVHGCGENFPLEPTADGVTAPANRRVEAFFFDGALGIQPPPPGPNSGPGSREYPEWVKRSRRTDDHVAVEGPRVLALRLHDESSKPMTGGVARVTIGSRRTLIDIGPDGGIAILLPLVCPARLFVEWGPPGASAPFPLAYDVVADCNAGDPATLQRNRLHNLGYHLENMSFDVAAARFQMDYGVDDKPPVGLIGGLLPRASAKRLEELFEGDCDASHSVEDDR